MALSDDKLWDLWNAHGAYDMSCAEAFVFARAIEAEVRKQDEALIRQMLEVLEYVRNTPEAEYDSKAALSKAQAAITAARARLGGKCPIRSEP